MGRGLADHLGGLHYLTSFVIPAKRLHGTLTQACATQQDMDLEQIGQNVMADPETTQAQLSLLVQTVGQASFVSAEAITLAILFTWIEKSLLTARYALIEALQHQIDSLFEGNSAQPIWNAWTSRPKCPVM